MQFEWLSSLKHYVLFHTGESNISLPKQTLAYLKHVPFAGIIPLDGIAQIPPVLLAFLITLISLRGHINIHEEISDYFTRY